MNRLKIYWIILIFSSISISSFLFFRNYNSPENIEKRCVLKFQKDFDVSLGISDKEWDQVMDLADQNYIRCMGFP
tara:strand:- start:479 stop:703 length:225 start_codon:yes stop_codon:yes gene_type:complete